MRFLTLSVGIGVYASALPAGVVTQNIPGPADRVDRILTQVEEVNLTLRDIRCRVRFVEDDRVNLTKRIKIGRIKFLDTEENPRFLIHFEKSEVDGLRGKQEWYLFDGRWMYEGIERLKQVTKREYVRPGESIDLFDLETAPFPLPFGQRKEQILHHFSVTLAPSTANDPADTDHLVCLPKPTSRLHRRYDKLEFFIRRDVHLPSRIVATGKGQEVITTADFPDLGPSSINSGLKEKDFSRPKAWRKYALVVEPSEPGERH